MAAEERGWRLSGGHLDGLIDFLLFSASFQIVKYYDLRRYSTCSGPVNCEGTKTIQTWRGIKI